jgi:hypothetical protein
MNTDDQHTTYFDSPERPDEQELQSDKELTEQYLKGSVTFISNAKVGTIFTLRISFKIDV